MKQLKTSLKFVVLFFVIALCLTTCQKEHFDPENELGKSNGFSIKKISGSDIQLNTEVSSILEQLRSSRPSKKESYHSREIYDSIHGFTIETDEAIYIENGDYHSYTFHIYDYNDTSFTKNLLLSLQPDLTYKVFIVSYDFTEEEKETIINNGYVSLVEKATFTLLENYDSTEITSNLSKIYYNAELDYCYELVQETSQGTGWSILVEQEVPCPQTGTEDDGYDDGGSNGGGGTGYDNGIPDDSNVPDYGDGNGGNSSGSSGNDQDNDNDDDTTETCIRDSDGNCIGNATTPILNDPIQNPCQKMNDLKNDDVFKQKMVALKNAAEQWSFEKVFTVYNDPTLNTSLSQSDNFDYGEFQGSINSPSAQWEGDSTMKGLIHSHYDGLLSIFSATDLRDLYNIMKDPFVTSNFFYGVVTHSGTAYILQISDRTAFINFGNKYLSTDKKLKLFIREQYEKKYNIDPDGSNTLNEKGFVGLLNELGAGLNIYKSTDLTFTDYKKLTYTNNQVSPSDCN